MRISARNQLVQFLLFTLSVLLLTACQGEDGSVDERPQPSNRELVKLEIRGPQSIVNVGDTINLQAVAIYDDQTELVPDDDVVWVHDGGTSIDSSVRGGNLTLSAPDKNTIYVGATFNGYVAGFTVRINREVSEESIPTGITLSTSSQQLQIGESVEVKVRAAYSDGSIVAVTDASTWWVVAGENRVTRVNNTLTATAEGAVQIQALYDNKYIAAATLNISAPAEANIIELSIEKPADWQAMYVYLYKNDLNAPSEPFGAWPGRKLEVNNGWYDVQISTDDFDSATQTPNIVLNDNAGNQSDDINTVNQSGYLTPENGTWTWAATPPVEPPANYELIVVGGAGSGEYAAGELIDISATMTGSQMFTKWSGSGANFVVDTLSANTSLLMPQQNVTLIAEFEEVVVPQEYRLTVQQGAGSGTYESGVQVVISADPMNGMVFSQWTGIGAMYVADSSASQTTLTMPGQNITIIPEYVTEIPVGAAETYAQQCSTCHGQDGKSGFGGSLEIGVCDRCDDSPADLASYIEDTMPLGAASQCGADCSGAMADYIQTVINADDTPVSYMLTVNTGSGSGSYAPNERVSVSAAAPQAGFQFKNWSGSGVDFVENAAAANTFIIMPATNIVLQANYEAIIVAPTLYSLVIDGGNGSGTYEAGTVVNISANNIDGYEFDRWSGDGSNYISSITSPQTTLLMPARNIAVTAELSEISEPEVPAAELYANSCANCHGADGKSGFGGSLSTEVCVICTDTVENLSTYIENTMPYGQASECIGECATTMAAYIKTVINDVPTTQSYTLTVQNGQGSGEYEIGETVTISANAPQTGYEFSDWSGSAVAYISNYQLSTTTVTMPGMDISVAPSYSLIPTEPEQLTFNIQKPASWSTVNVYAWIGAGGNGNQPFGAWPGKSLVENNGWYSVTFDESDIDSTTGAPKVVFNDNGNSQTPNITDRSTSGYLVLNGSDWVWSDTAPTEPQPEDMFQLTVTSGSGSGSYTENTTVQVSANEISGMQFSEWSGNGAAYLANSNAANTTLSMPASNVAIAATYVSAPNDTSITYHIKQPESWGSLYVYHWHENTGSSTEVFGAWPGQQFNSNDGWAEVTIQKSNFDNNSNAPRIVVNDNGGNQSPDITDRSTSGYLMLEAGSWTWYDVNPEQDSVQLAVENGTGTGSYLPGSVVDIRADDPELGYQFVQWSGEGSQYVANTSSQNTTITMPSSSTSVQAVYVLEGDEYALGRSLYQDQCARCHGASGEGVGDYPGVNNLTFRYSQTSLAQKIEFTMPPSYAGGAEECNGTCATEIAKVLLADQIELAVDCSGGLTPSDRQMRLLSQQELKATLSDLTGVNVDVSAIPDTSKFMGFSNSAKASVSESHVTGYLDLAANIASQTNLRDLANRFANCGGTDSNCQIETFGKYAFRRPLTSSERTTYQTLYSQNGEDAVVTAILASPALLYRTEFGERMSTLPAGVATDNDYAYYQLSDYEAASILSYTYWGTMPNSALLDLADRGQLSSQAQIKQALESVVLNDSRAEANYGEFVSGWLDISSLEDKGHISDTQAASFKAETKRFATEVAFSDGNYADLLTANYSFLDSTLSQTYGYGNVSGSDFERVTYSDGARSGILGHGSVLAKTAIDSDQPNIITRGLFVREHLLCQELGSPPPNGGDLPDLESATSNREYFDAHSSDAACSFCHQYIDPIGFGTENFDGLGRFRTTENYNGTINSLTGLGTLSNSEIEGAAAGQGGEQDFQYISGLASLIAQSDNAKQCYIRQYYRFMTGEVEIDNYVASEDACTIDSLAASISSNGMSLKEQLVEMTQTPVWLIRKVRN